MLASCGTRALTLHSFDESKGVSVNAEIADDASTREIGLMNRKKLDEGTAMLFAFPTPQILQFWMKDTLISLEILFFDEQGSFVNALTMEPCTKNPCAIYKSAALAQYALEVPPGFREKNEVGVGWKIDPEFLKGIEAK
jgi:uncharacterized membrane protein (UPF0127 family)